MFICPMVRGGTACRWYPIGEQFHRVGSKEPGQGVAADKQGQTAAEGRDPNAEICNQRCHALRARYGDREDPRGADRRPWASRAGLPYRHNAGCRKHYRILLCAHRASALIETAFRGAGARCGCLTFEYPLKADGDKRADDGADDVNPGRPHVAAHQIRRQRANGIHRCATDGCRPKPGERNVAADGQRAVRADVARAGGGAEDRAHKSGRQRHLHDQRLKVADTGTRDSGAEMRDVAEHGAQKTGGQQAAGALGDHVARYTVPGKIAPGGKGERDRRITHQSVI